MGRERKAGPLPVPNPARIDMDEVRFGIIPDSPLLEGDRDFAQIREVPAGEADIDRPSLHVEAFLGNPRGVFS